MNPPLGVFLLCMPPLIADSDASDAYSSASDADPLEFDAESPNDFVLAH